MKIKEYGTKQSKYIKFKDEFDNISSRLKDNLTTLTNYMMEQDLINRQFKLTPWGLIVKEIHDCNPYVLSKIVMEGDFDNLSPPILLFDRLSWPLE